MTQSGSRMAERRQLLKEQCLTKPPNPSFIKEADFTRLSSLKSKSWYPVSYLKFPVQLGSASFIVQRTKRNNSVAFNRHRRSLFSWLKDFNVTKRKDQHWRPYERICPCEVDYDFIGHFENLTEEAPQPLKI